MSTQLQFRHGLGTDSETRSGVGRIIDSEKRRQNLADQFACPLSLPLALFRYLTVWHASLTAATSIPAITHELSQTKTSALSANHLLAALVQDYGMDQSLDQTFASIVTTEPIVSKNDAPVRPTLSNAQALLGLLLQQVLDVVMRDWDAGDFQDMAKGGMLLNSSVETTKFLTGRLESSKRRRR